VILWIDAQISPALAPWFQEEFNIEAFSAEFLKLKDATDAQIYDLAGEAGATILTKDSDFVALQQQLGSPPQVVWLRLGNSTNQRLRELLLTAWPRCQSALESGESLVEIKPSIDGDVAQIDVC